MRDGSNGHDRSRTPDKGVEALRAHRLEHRGPLAAHSNATLLDSRWSDNSIRKEPLCVSKVSELRRVHHFSLTLITDDGLGRSPTDVDDATALIHDGQCMNCTYVDQTCFLGSRNNLDSDTSFTLHAFNELILVQGFSHSTGCDCTHDCIVLVGKLRKASHRSNASVHRIDGKALHIPRARAKTHRLLIPSMNLEHSSSTHRRNHHVERIRSYIDGSNWTLHIAFVCHEWPP